MSYQSYTYSSSTQPTHKSSSSPALYPSTYVPAKFPTYKVDGSFPYHAISTTASSSYDHSKPTIVVTGSSPKQTHHSSTTPGTHDPLSFFHPGSKPSTTSYDPNYLSPPTSATERPKNSALRSISPKKIEQNGGVHKHTTHATNHIDVGPYSQYSTSYLANKNHNASQPLFTSYVPPVNSATQSERNKKLIFETASSSENGPKSDRVPQDAGWKTGLVGHAYSPSKNPYASNHTSHGHENHTKTSYQPSGYQIGHGDTGKAVEFNFDVTSPKTDYTPNSFRTRFIESDHMAKDSYQKPVKSINDPQKALQINPEPYKPSIGTTEYSSELYRPHTTQAAASSTMSFAHYHDLLASVKEPEVTGLQDKVMEKHPETYKQAGFNPHLGNSIQTSNTITTGASPYTITNELSYEYSRPNTTQAVKSTGVYGHNDHSSAPARESYKIFSLKEKSPEVPKQSGFGFSKNDHHSHHLVTHTTQPHHTSMKHPSPERTREFTHVRQKPQAERVAKAPMRFIEHENLLPSAQATYQKPAVTKVTKKNIFEFPDANHAEGVKKSSVPSQLVTTSHTSHSHNVGPTSAERQRATIFNNDPSRNLVSVPPKVDHTSSHQTPLTTATFSHDITHGPHQTYGTQNDFKYDYYRPSTGLSTVKTAENYKSSGSHSHGADHFGVSFDKHAGLMTARNPSSYDSPRRGDYEYLHSSYSGAGTSRY